MSYQTFVVIIIAISTFAIGLIAANEQALGVSSPWVTLVVIPTVLSALGLAQNQMKSIGAPPPNTVTRTDTSTVTATPPKAP